ncbi:MAG: GNAT family N-acetyltransferase [Burkholderiales bacterium]|nr:GNAT family N-acetyltransferase [Burkholderiales bacterium]
MSAVLRNCTSTDLERLLPVLDENFIYSKGRSKSLASRFPSVYCAANAHNIYLVEEAGEILSALAVKHVDWHADGHVWRGAMIGGVITSLDRRGQGWASRLLASTEQALRIAGIDFAVLWTAQPAFYARLGWNVQDSGMFGEMSGGSDVDPLSDRVQVVSMADAKLADIECLRQKHCAFRIQRHAEDYGQIPIPANCVELLWSEQDGQTAYALVGDADQTGIVYEMVGAPERFAALMANLSARYQRIYVNDFKSSESYDWLASNTDIRWQEKPLTMWRALSDKVNAELVSQWYIPYFDRI